MVRPNNEIRRADLLDSAADLFSTRGFHATSMRDLAQKMEIKAGSLYYHIASKEQLLDEVCSIGMDQLSMSVSRAVELNANLPDTIKAVITGHVALIQQYGHFLHCYQNEYKHLAAEAGTVMRTKLVAFHRTIDSIFTRAIAAGEARPDLNVKHARLAVIAMLQLLSRPDAQRNQANRDAVAEGLSDILINGCVRR